MMLGHIIFKRLAKALISLCVCAGWSEPLLVARTTLLEISCHGSFIKVIISGQYYQTRCRKGDPQCTPCEERLPSCIGMPDGANGFPSRRNSEYYVKCFMNRTVAVEVCQVSLFDEATRACSNKINPGKIYQQILNIIQ